jgi:hypothetical protein
MIKAEAIWGPERGSHLYKTSETAVRMIVERLNLEKIGLPFETLPLCTEDESVCIEELIPRAKEGFALALKSDRSLVGQDKDILDITTPMIPEHIWANLKLADRQNTLPEYNHVLATLMLLSQTRKVSFYQFPEPPANIDYQTGMAETYWAHSTDSFETVWNRMVELEDLVRSALYSENRMKREDMLKVGHFFMTGKALSGIFDGR